MPPGWQQGLTPVPDNLKGLLVSTLTPAYLRQTYLLGVTLGVAWDGAPGDAAMQQMLNAAIADAQSKLGISFTPKVILTDPDPGLVQGVDYDILGQRLPYVRPGVDSSFFYLPLPHAHVTSITRVRLFLNDEVIYTIPAEWIHFTTKEGILRIFPGINGIVVQGQYGGIGGPYLHWIGQTTIPDAWSVDYTIGYGQVDYDVAHYIGLSSAIAVLALAGSGADITGGLTTESLSQDGITESVGYYHGDYGPYTGTIKAYKDELDKIDLLKKRAAKKGLKMMMI